MLYSATQNRGKLMQFGLMFFASGEDALRGDKYRLVLESAKFADRHGFSSVWVPERHFTKFGCLYPNPAVLHAALARETKQIRLQAGSVVLPLHNPIRVAEEWAVVDNLSGGRVGISFASGWNPNDFAFFPERYADRRREMYAGIQTVQRLWRGESVWVKSGNGAQVEIKTYPKPIQPELPTWITAAGDPNTFIKAGEIGANLLTHMFDQGIEKLAENIALYRQARSRHGHAPECGRITVTLHTFIGHDNEAVREQVRKPYCTYLKSNADLLKLLGYSRGSFVDISEMSPEELDRMANLVFEKFSSNRALLGTPETCLDLVDRLSGLGVNELACLLDFGPDVDLILNNLPHLNRLKEYCRPGHARDSALRNIEPAPGAPTEGPKAMSAVDRQNLGAPKLVSQFEARDLLNDIQGRCDQEITGSGFYDQLFHLGVQVDRDLRVIQHLWRRDGEALGKVQLLDVVELDANPSGIHPAFLDACFHLLFAAIPTETLSTSTSQKSYYLPVRLGKVQVVGSLSKQIWSHATLRSGASEMAGAFEGDVRILDVSGKTLVEVSGLRLEQALPATEPNCLENVSNWFYEVEWQPRAHPGQSSGDSPLRSLPSPMEIAKRVQVKISQFDVQQELELCAELLPKLEALSAVCVLWAFQQLGWRFELKQRVSVASLAVDLGIAETHRRLLGRLVQILQEENVLNQLNETQWEVCRVPEVTDPQDVWKALLTQYPTCSPELNLLAQCGGRLASVLRGNDPLQLLFPSGSLTAVERLYQDSPGARIVNQVVNATISAALERLPEKQKVRVLEIGAGTGGTTSYVLPVMPADRTDYVFSDVSHLFTWRAEQKFRDYTFVRYQLLDIEQDPMIQGCGFHQFDLILAANVLHATKDLRQVLGHVQQLLARDGLLILLEGTKPQRWLDLTFGLTVGWWKFTDLDLRPNYSLLDREQWCGLLREVGFAEIEAITSEGSNTVLSHQAVILAKGFQVKSEAQLVEAVPNGAEGRGRWLIFADRGGIGQRLAEQLKADGEENIIVHSGKSFERIREERFIIDPSRPEDFQRLFREISGGDEKRLRGAVHLWSLDVSDPTKMMLPELQAASILECHSALYLVRALIMAGFSEFPKLWLVTRGAQPVTSGVGLPGLFQSMLWGLGRVISVEEPQLWGGLVDLDPDTSMDYDALDLSRTIRNRDGDDHLAVRNRQYYSARLVRKRGVSEVKSQPEFRRNGSYLITGGLGDLGLLVARWMAARGAKNLILLGRTQLPARANWTAVEDNSRLGGQIAAIQDIERLGANAYLASADVADELQMAALLKRIEREGIPPIRGIVHAAGVPHPLVPLQQLDGFTLDAALRPKVFGGWVLHRLFEHTPLDFFVLFSSWAGLLGSVGQRMGGYSAANTFLDALAHYRGTHGLPALSLDWGDWAEVGMRARYVREGYRLLPESWTLKPQEGVRSLEQLVQQSSVQVAILPVKWEQFFQIFPQTANLPFLAKVPGNVGRRETDGEELKHRAEFLRRLQELPASAQMHFLISHVQDQVAKVMGFCPSDSLDPQRGLYEMGMDSLMALQLKHRLESSIGQSISIIATVEHPTIAALAEYLARDVLRLGLYTTDNKVLRQGIPVEDSFERIEQLTDDEVDRLFEEKISQSEVLP